jgi:hypothetical protein
MRKIQENNGTGSNNLNVRSEQVLSLSFALINLSQDFVHTAK